MATFPVKLFIESTGKVKTTQTGGTYYSELNRIPLKRGDSASFEVLFLEPGTNTALPLTATTSKVQIAMKEAGGYGSSIYYCAFGQSSADPDPTSDPYVVPVVIASSALSALFAIDGGGEKAYVDVMFEVSWTEDSQTTWNSTTAPIVARIYNEVVKTDLTAIWLD
jgi:hypothetical protein